MKTFTLITAALILSGSILSVVQAAAPSEVPTAVVKFGGLDTTRPAGKEELYRRLSRATQAVCSPLKGPDSFKARVNQQFEICKSQSMARAVAQINRQEFTDYVATRTPKSVGTDTRLASR